MQRRSTRYCRRDGSCSYRGIVTRTGARSPTICTYDGTWGSSTRNTPGSEFPRFRHQFRRHGSEATNVSDMQIVGSPFDAESSSAANAQPVALPNPGNRPASILFRSLSIAGATTPSGSGKPSLMTGLPQRHRPHVIQRGPGQFPLSSPGLNETRLMWDVTMQQQYCHPTNIRGWDAFGFRGLKKIFHGHQDPPPYLPV